MSFFRDVRRLEFFFFRPLLKFSLFSERFSFSREGGLVTKGERMFIERALRSFMEVLLAPLSDSPTPPPSKRIGLIARLHMTMVVELIPRPRRRDIFLHDQGVSSLSTSLRS